MADKPLKAKDIVFEVFTSEQYGDDIEEWQLAVNGWLKNQPDNIVVHDIHYHHCGRNAKGKDVLSVAVISSPAS